MPDGTDKTIWGKEQKDWFKRTVQASDTTFRVLISPTPVVGPDRHSKRDNHSNKNFKHEGDEIRQFISQQKNMVVVCDDRHWQYYSISLLPHLPISRFSFSAASTNLLGPWRITSHVGSPSSLSTRSHSAVTSSSVEHRWPLTATPITRHGCMILAVAS
jgi:hypothetical protein